MKKVVRFKDRKTIEHEAADWLVRLDGDSPLTEHDKRELGDWMNSSPQHRQALEELSDTWDDANILTELAVPLNQTRAESKSRFAITPRGLSAIAASLFIALSIGVVSVFNSNAITNRNGMITTDIGDQKSITLPDGSVIKVNTNSKVKVDFNKEFRNIYLLQGEAHFSVAKDRSKPFRVYAGSGRIHAIGTAFTVYLKQDQIDVTVSEGRVGVASIPDASEPNNTNASASSSTRSVKSLGMLRAGEAGSIVSSLDKDSKPTQKLDNLRKIENVDTARELSWTDGVLVFAGDPLEDVVKEISRYTPVSIKFSDPKLKSIRIGGRFPVGETDTMFASLETSFGLEVTRLDSDNVVISSAKNY